MAHEDARRQSMEGNRCWYLLALLCCALLISSLIVAAAPGDIVWTFKTGNWVRTSPALAADGTIVFGSDDGFLYAVNADGTEKWRFQTPGPIWRGAALAADGTAYVAVGGGTLLAVDEDGTERWRLDLGVSKHVSSKPAIGADGTVYVGSDAGMLYAVTPEGEIDWTYAAGTGILSSPSIGPDGTIYVGAEDGFFHGVNPDGTQRFVHSIRWDMDVRSSPAIATDGTVLVGASDGYLYALARDGQLQWELNLTTNVLFSSPSIATDGTIYIGSYDKKLHAVSDDGTLRWAIELDGLISSSPTVGADGTIYIGSEQGTLYAVSPTGTILWTASAVGSFYFSSPAIAADGTVYVASFDNHLYAIESSSLGLANSPWPTLGRNASRTSRSAGADVAAADAPPADAVPAPSVSLTTWALPDASGYPVGLDIDALGHVYVADAGGREVLRLDPTVDSYRSWGVGEGPEDVVFVDGTVFCTIGASDQLVYFHPDSQAVSTVTLPSSALGLRELHRGLDGPAGDWILWLAEREAQGVLRYSFDPDDAPEIVGTQSDADIRRKESRSVVTSLAARYEWFPYDLTVMPAPEPFTASLDRGRFTEWRLDINEYLVEDIAAGPDGILWISAGVPFLFRLNPVADTLQMVETIPNAAIFQGLLPDPDGSIWFGNLLEGGIGHFDPALGVSETWRIPGTSEVYDLVFDSEGAVWYTDRVGDAIGRLDPRTGEVTVFALPAGSEPLHLTIDPTGNVWFTAGSGGYIGRLDTANP
jgi:outer membrane protein assembly factor BamB